MTKFKHRTPIQIRFKDVDALGHVNNANHLTYFELARMKYSADVLGPIDWSKNGFILASAKLEYKRPILLHDQVFVLSRTSKTGTKSFEMEHEIIRIEKDGTETLLASGGNVLVCMEYQTMKTITLPEEWRNKVTTFEAM
jgi:acyl-CoA thioester hydrolase